MTVDRNQPADRDEARRLADAATPGPWRWLGNVDSADIRLQTRYGHGLTVLRFARHGMRGAQPVFQVDGMLVDGKDLVRYEVAPEATSRKDPKVYRGDINGIRHPDAEFIAAARSLVPALLDELDAVGADRDQLRTKLAEANRALGSEIWSHDELQEETIRLRAQVQAAGRNALNEVERIVKSEVGPGDVYMRADVLSAIAQVRSKRAAALVPTNPEPRPQRQQLSRATLLYEAEHMGVEVAIDAALDITQPYEVPRWDEDRIVIENGWLDGRCGRCGEPLPVGVLTDQPDPAP